ncbi:MAG: putative negative regulator of RcsB-dependent stress response [Halioglobus sp.]
MDSYRTEDEQVEAIRRWWDDNGKSTIVAIVVALSAGFGWQAWKGHEAEQAEVASGIYLSMLQNLEGENRSIKQLKEAADLASQLKTEFASTSYAQFAALHLAGLAVSKDQLTEAEAHLRWVLSKAGKGGDVAQITELRLARVLAAAGKADQAQEILQRAGAVSYSASYAVARGDILLQLGRKDEARDAYKDAQTLMGPDANQLNLATLNQKLQSLSPIPARLSVAAAEMEAVSSETDALESPSVQQEP